jgi:hypothetical protein
LAERIDGAITRGLVLIGTDLEREAAILETSLRGFQTFNGRADTMAALQSRRFGGVDRSSVPLWVAPPATRCSSRDRLRDFQA